jgi:hypothetical protein
LGKVLSLLGLAVAAPAALAAPRRPALAIPLDPYEGNVRLGATHEFCVPGDQMDAFISKVLGGFDPEGEPNAFVHTCRLEKCDGWWDYEMRQHLHPVGRFTHQPMRHPYTPFLRAYKITGAEGGFPFNRVTVEFAPLPFSVTHLPQVA